MIQNKKLLSCLQGGVIILVAIVLPLLLLVMAAAIDTGRLYAVRGKAQAAMDSALLGAVATRSSKLPAVELAALFNANYPSGYLGSTISGMAFTQPADGMYSASLTVTVPMLLLGRFGTNISTLAIASQVKIGYPVTSERSLELALVLDNSASANTIDMQTAAGDLTGSLYGTAGSAANMHVSIIPFDVAVNAQGRGGWIQSAWASSYTHYIANRNGDNPPDGYNDISDDAPHDDPTRFRVPSGNGNDVINAALAPMQFGLSNRGDIAGALAAMQPAGHTRLKVGLMWGWFALSPDWQGVWDGGPLPAAFDDSVQKALVLAVGSLNDVYDSDDTTTGALCDAIKAEGISVYVVGIGASINEDLLRSCASHPAWYSQASTAEELQMMFHRIGDMINGETLRLNP